MRYALIPGMVGLVAVALMVGPGTTTGASAAPPVALVDSGAAPTLTQLSPAAGTPAGGTRVHLRGTGFVAGASVTFGTDAGTEVSVASPTSLEVTAPAHEFGSVSVRVATSFGRSPTGPTTRFAYRLQAVSDLSATAAEHRVALSWKYRDDSDVTGVMIRRDPYTAPTSPKGGTLIADVPVGTTRAADTTVALGFPYGYSVFTHDDAGHYSPAHPITVTTPGGITFGSPVSLGFSAHELSCPSTTFCMAVGYNNQAATFDGQEWTPTDPVPGDPVEALDCVGATFCAAINYDSAVVYTGTWSAPVPVNDVDRDGGILAVGCLALGHCIALTEYGYAYELRQGTWRGPVGVGECPGDGTRCGFYISCASARFCGVVGVSGAFDYFDGTTWHGGGYVGLRGPRSLSCTSARSCTVAGHQIATRWDGTSWTPEKGFDAADVKLSCPTDTWCLASSEAGVRYFNGSVWSGDVLSDAALGGITCPTRYYCIAAASHDNDTDVRIGTPSP